MAIGSSKSGELAQAATARPISKRRLSEVPSTKATRRRRTLPSISELIGPAGSPIQAAVNRQLWPVLRVVALSTSTGTLAARRQLSFFGVNESGSPLGLIV